MTILSGQSIRRRGIFTPFHERTVANGMTFGLGPAGYDVRIREPLYLYPRDYVLASTIEHFDMPPDLLGRVMDKSSWARRGITVQNTCIEPGWCGWLTLEIANHSRQPVEIPAGAPIAQIILELLDEPTEAPYSGRYQCQPARPVPAIAAE
jgi:dCTP deaminase